MVVIAADEKDRIIRPRSGDHCAQKHDGLVGNAQAAQLGDSRYYCLCDHHRYPDRYQRQQHGERVAVNHQQDGKHQDGDCKLNWNPIPFARDCQVGHGGRGSGKVCCQLGPGWAVFQSLLDSLLNKAGNPLVGGVGPRSAQLARNADRHYPGFVVPTGQDRTQGRRADKILQHHDISRVLAQRVRQLVVGGFVGGAKPLLVGQYHQQKVFRARFVKRLGHLSGGDA